MDAFALDLHNGEAVIFANIYEAFSSWGSYGEGRQPRYGLTWRADQTFWPGGANLQQYSRVRRVGKEREPTNVISAQSNFRPAVLPLDPQTPADLVQLIAELDATNVARDRLFRQCRLVRVHVKPYEYRFERHGQSYSGGALSLERIEIGWDR